jgi:hypothetical protein
LDSSASKQLEIPSFLKSRKNIKMYKTSSHIKVPKNDKNKIFDLIGGNGFPRVIYH